MKWFWIWNVDNEDEGAVSGCEVGYYACAEDAAVAYAANDSDGISDGFYVQTPQTICVRDVYGTLFAFNVQADLQPKFHATPIDPKSV